MASHKNAPQGAYLRSARRNPLADCPLTAAFAAVGGKWKLTIIYWLAREEHHFSGLMRRVAPISHKVLTETLRVERRGRERTDECDQPGESFHVPSPRQYIAEELDGSRIPRLAEPEHRALSDLDITIVLRNVDQLVDRFSVVTLRQNEGEVLAQREWCQVLVERDEIPRRSVALAEPEECLVARGWRAVAAGDANERGHSLIVRLLR